MQKRTISGFTVHELLITIVIISIIVGTAGPNLVHLVSERRDEAGVFALWSTLNGAQMLVAKNDSPVLVTFDLDNNKYAVYSDEDVSGTGESEEKLQLNLTDTIIFALPSPVPSVNAPGADDLTLISSSWKNDGIVVSNNSVFAISAGYVYLKNRARPNIGYCLLVREASSSVELLKWNGSQWYQM